MEQTAKLLFDAIEKTMQQNNTKDSRNIQNIKESLAYIKRTFQNDDEESEQYFENLCKKYGYDIADFSDAKIV